MNRVVSMMLLILACGGCSVILAPGESQCEVAADCEARGFAGAACNDGVCEKAMPADPVWGCLGHVDNPVPDTTKKVTISVPLFNAADSTPATNVTVDVCDKLDINCTGPNNDHFPKGLHPGPDGVMHMTLFQGFDGYIRATSPEFMDARLFVGRPIVTAPILKEVRLLKPDDFQLLAAFAKQDVDTTRGTAILYAVDCQGKPASGVRFSVPSADTTSKEFYLVSLAPTPYPTAEATDIDGFGGFFNLPPGQTLAETTRAEGGTYIGESGFQVLANTISYVLIAPTPK